jgi:hypothetical protein
MVRKVQQRYAVKVSDTTMISRITKVGSKKIFNAQQSMLNEKCIVLKLLAPLKNIVTN